MTVSGANEATCPAILAAMSSMYASARRRLGPGSVARFGPHRATVIAQCGYVGDAQDAASVGQFLLRLVVPGRGAEDTGFGAGCREPGKQRACEERFVVGVGEYTEHATRV